MKKRDGMKNKSLMVIDDTSIRKSAFAAAEKLIKKLDRIEADFDSFREHDQRLFIDWRNLTFRNEQQEIDSLQAEYAHLARRHNWIIAEARKHDLSMPRAYRIIRDEEALYASGTAEDRARIDGERRKRDDYIREEMEREFADDPFGDLGFDADDDDGYDDDSSFDSDSESEANDSSRGDRERNGGGRKRSAEDEQEFRAIRQMSDKRLRQICKDGEQAFALLARVMELSRADDDLLLLLRIWDLTPQRHQKRFAGFFRDLTGQSIHSLFDDLRETAHAKQDEDQFGDEDHEAAGARFAGRDSRNSNEKRTKSGEDLEAVKILYRKLVRILHPDLQDDSTLAQRHWQKKLWARTQAAYHERSRPKLARLYLMALIRSGSVQDLKVSELRDSQFELTEELADLKNEAQSFKRHPAWGFSRRKDFKPLHKKILKEFERELDHLHGEVDELRGQHELLDLLSKTESPRRRLKKKSASRKSKAKRQTQGRHHRQANTSSHPSGQTSFFE